jgi:starch synthase (maltosyl-transferring)
MTGEIDGRCRVIIEGVQPEIDGGLFAIKRNVGGSVVVHADIFTDGHDALVAKLKYRFEQDGQWQEVNMTPLGNDRWTAEFQVTEVGQYWYAIEAWVDRYSTWHRDFQKRVAAKQVAAVDLMIGANLMEAASARASGTDAVLLALWGRRLRHDEAVGRAKQISENAELAALIRRCPGRDFAVTYDHQLRVIVDRDRAAFSAWYEMFPRSAASDPGRPGTLKDVESRLPYVVSMGFDVLYLPPIHPVGACFRKGKNNAEQAETGDVGSPWGIGSEDGGHKAVHPDLGTLDDFRQLVASAHDRGIEIALDIAFQCSPDHPYVDEHPDWFRQRPDGSIQYAENPPKKYQDIYPFDFETADWRSLWEELKSIFDFWIQQGVQIFRVDNPHTKPFAFWEWCIGEIKRDHPNVLFLSEAFTRPKIMYRLAKLGFTQSYTYFAWRNTKDELTEYVTELTQTSVREFFRPNFWPNTPDILTEYLQVGERPAFIARLVLAATLSPNYGIYGPPFEHGWNMPREPGSEEYLNSEKYQVHYHEIQRPDSLNELIARLNRLRRDFAVLQSHDRIRFHEIDNDQLICYSRTSEDLTEMLLIIVNLDPHYTQTGWIELTLDDFKLDETHAYQVHDLLSDERFLWHGPKNFVELNPGTAPAHIFQLSRRVRTEQDFENYI